MVRRRELLAYLIGAGVAGTLLAAPFALRAAAGELFMPGRILPLVPIILLPILWGVWNVIRVRHGLAASAGAWGAFLGVVVAVVVNLVLAATGSWFGQALAVFGLLPVAYWLVWRLIVGPLNEALGVEAGHGGASDVGGSGGPGEGAPRAPQRPA